MYVNPSDSTTYLVFFNPSFDYDSTLSFLQIPPAIFTYIVTVEFFKQNSFYSFRSSKIVHRHRASAAISYTDTACRCVADT